MNSSRIVLLNDTDVDGYHFGCARVISIIRNQLAARGCDLEASIPVSLNWRDKHADIVKNAKLLVINGEGTLHHGSRRGRWLLEAAQTVSGNGGKVALINALWQDNPSDWATLIRNVDILACRDSRSAAALSAETGRNVRMLGDLSMTQSPPISTASRHGILLGDSVHANVTNRLAQLVNVVPDAEIIPITNALKFVSPHLAGIRRRLRTLYGDLKQRKYLSQNSKARFLRDEVEYFETLQSKSLTVTGRFHAACLAVASRTPLITVSSNSWKIEALLEDVGLSNERMLELNELTSETLEPKAWAYSKQEAERIETKLSQWHRESNQLFDDIAALI